MNRASPLKFLLPLLFVVLGTSSPLFLSSPATAQEGSGQGEDLWSGIEEMVVLSAGSLGAQDFADADSVIAFDNDDLAAIGAQDISDLADFTPNLEIVTSGSTTPTFFIRGVGLNDFNSNSTGAVAIYQDGVAINAPAMQLGTLFDIENVNVLRGPQGVGLNRNASAGSIKIYSKKPSGETGGFLRADFGDYDYMDYEGAVESPILGDVVAGRVAFRFSKRDGFMKNRCAGAPAFADRTPYPGGAAFRGDAPWSICGEQEVFLGSAISDIPVGLEKFVNDLNNWAARATFTIEPDLGPIESSWVLNFHGGRRDEFSQLGQSYGTGGGFCRDGDICQAPFFGTPIDERGTISSGVLGGPQGRTGGDYQPREVLQRLAELAPCTAEINPVNGRRGTCRSVQPGETPADVLADRSAENRAKIQVARELARDLDDRPWEGDFNRTGKTTNTVLGGFLKGDIELPAEISMTMTTGFDTYDRQIDSDVDFSPETLFHIVTTDDGWQLYQDVEFNGEVDAFDNPIRWELGGWFHREILNVLVENDLGDDTVLGVGSREYRQKGWSGGASLSLSFDFWEDFTFDGGARYNYDRKSLDYTLLFGGGASGGEATNLDEVWQAPTGTIRLTYNFREDTHVYWKYTRGWKPGTYNATSGQGREVSVADSEELDSYEFGLAGSWFDDRLKLNGALFYYSYADYQIFTTEQQAGGNTVFVTLNANDAEVYGAELDATIYPWEHTQLGLRFSWLESQFLDFTQTNTVLAGSGIFIQEVQNSGNPLLNSPRFKVIVMTEQTLPLGSAGSLTARYDGVWTDDAFFDASEGLGNPNILGERFLPEFSIGQRAYWLHNLRVTWKSVDGLISVAGWVRNLENKAYKTFAFDASAFQKTTVYFVGNPRTMGASITVTF